MPDKPVSATSPPLASTSGSPPAATASSSTAPTSKALPPPKKKSSQKGLLAGAIKRKSSGSEEKVSKRKLSSSTPAPEAKVASDSTATLSKPEEGLSPGKDTQKPSSEAEAGAPAIPSANQDAAAKKRKMEAS